MAVMMMKPDVVKIELNENYYYSAAHAPTTGLKQEDVKKYLAFAKEFDMQHISPKPYETHMILNHHKDYIETYNLETGTRDTIQKSSINESGFYIKKLGKIQQGSDIMKKLDELQKSGEMEWGEPVLLNLVYEDVEKDKYFIALEYVTDVREGLVVVDKEEVLKDVRRTCAIVTKQELDHYKERYPHIVNRRVGI